MKKTQCKKMDKVFKDFQLIIKKKVLMQVHLPKKNKWKCSNKVFQKEQACQLQKIQIEKVKLMEV